MLVHFRLMKLNLILSHRLLIIILVDFGLKLLLLFNFHFNRLGIFKNEPIQEVHDVLPHVFEGVSLSQNLLEQLSYFVHSLVNFLSVSSKEGLRWKRNELHILEFDNESLIEDIELSVGNETFCEELPSRRVLDFYMHNVYRLSNIFLFKPNYFDFYTSRVHFITKIRLRD